MNIKCGRSTCPDVIKTHLWFIMALFLNVIPFMCNAGIGKEVTTLFMDSTGKELCRFKTEIAVTPEEQSRGLMFRKKLGFNSGMLFINNSDEMRFFWMKNTYIPLDILFINSRNEVKHIHYGAKPFDEAPISSQYPVQYILEINAGRAKKCNIRQGSRMNILKSVR